jgi:hypothetical protein
MMSSIGTEIENGAVNVAYAMYETMVLNWNAQSRPSPIRVLGENPFTDFLERASLGEKKQWLKENCDIKIVGISAQLQRSEKVKLLMALKQYAESPMFGQFIWPKKLLDETIGAIGMYKAPFIKSDDELEQSQAGAQIVDVLGKLAASGGPEIQARIKEFVNSLSAQAQPINIQGDNNGGGQMPTTDMSQPAPVPGA